jgi:hypothetical protein
MASQRITTEMAVRTSGMMTITEEYGGNEKALTVKLVTSGVDTSLILTGI